MVQYSRQYKTSIKEVYNAALKTLQECGFSILERGERSIRASSNLSLVSWGENIEVTIETTKNDTEVIITSEPTSQLFDWGKSEENVNRIFELIDVLLQKSR